MKTFGQARIAGAHEHGVDLSVAGGGDFSVQVLATSMVRVRYKPAGGYREPRTWAIPPSAGRAV